MEFIANDYGEERVTFIAPSGNDGSGYGTVGAPAGPSTLVVGQCLDNTFADLRTVHHYGDVSELSSRGPTASGLIKPDVVAIGVGEVNLPLGAGGEKSSDDSGRLRLVVVGADALEGAITESGCEPPESRCVSGASSSSSLASSAAESAIVSMTGDGACSINIGAAANPASARKPRQRTSHPPPSAR